MAICNVVCCCYWTDNVTREIFNTNITVEKFFLFSIPMLLLLRIFLAVETKYFSLLLILEFFFFICHH